MQTQKSLQHEEDYEILNVNSAEYYDEDYKEKVSNSKKLAKGLLKGVAGVTLALAGIYTAINVNYIAGISMSLISGVMESLALVDITNLAMELNEEIKTVSRNEGKVL